MKRPIDIYFEERVDGKANKVAMKYWLDKEHEKLISHTVIFVERADIITNSPMQNQGNGACSYEDYYAIRWGPKDLIPELWLPRDEPAILYMGEMCMDE